MFKHRSSLLSTVFSVPVLKKKKKRQIKQAHEKEHFPTKLTSSLYWWHRGLHCMGNRRLQNCRKTKASERERENEEGRFHVTRILQVQHTTFSAGNLTCDQGSGKGTGLTQTLIKHCVQQEWSNEHRWTEQLPFLLPRPSHHMSRGFPKMPTVFMKSTPLYTEQLINREEGKKKKKTKLEAGISFVRYLRS